MRRREIIGTIVVALFTAGSAPWWWDRVFENGDSSKNETLPNGTVGVDIPTSTKAIATARPPADLLPTMEPTHPLHPVTACEGKWYIQMAAGHDKQGLMGVVDKIRSADTAFIKTGLYTSSGGNYRVVLGCFDRFEADRLKERFEDQQVLENPVLVTLGQSLDERVY